MRTIAADTAGRVGAEVAYVAEVIAERPGRARVVVSTGERPAEGTELEIDELAQEVSAPVRGLDGEVIGRVAVASSHPIEPTSEVQAALDLFAAHAAADLERRRIGRALHDGAQQRLVAIGHFLDVAQRKIDDDSAQAATLVERAREEAREAGRELREMARELNPWRTPD